MVAAGALALGIVVVVVSGWPFVRDMVTRRVGDVAALEAEQEKQVGLYASAMEQRVKQINGRSMFFVPPAPADVAEQEKEEAPDEGPAPKPTRYAGPDVIAVINGTVWFGNDRRIAVGDEEDGIKVVSVSDSPWSVKLEWRGVEFDVQVFERTTDRFLEKEEGGT
jgi:hypothetical protein